MLEYFDTDGHLTNFAFEMIIKGEADELNRLDVSEHLSFCDTCLEKYMNSMETCILEEPEKSLVPEVMKRIKNKVRNIFISKYATLAVAASFAVVLWTAGVFNVDYAKMNEKYYIPLEKTTSSFAEVTESFSEDISESFNKIFHYNFQVKGVLKDGKK